MAKQYISAQEINQLFHQPKKPGSWPSWQLLSAGLLIGLGLFAFLNAPAIGQQLGYWWETDIQAGQKAQEIEVKTKQPEVVNESVQQVGENSSSKIQTPNNKYQNPNSKNVQASFDPQSLAENTIYIPRIRVKAPIVWDVSAGDDLNADLLKALEKGVARYPKTALPNQVGNVFLTGHSSNYWWEKGSYKTIFALLNRLVAGDQIYIKYQGQAYTYKVSAQKVVKPTETSVLNPTTSPTLSLMTCTPTGTSLMRRIVIADLVSPQLSGVAQPTKPDLENLESVR